MVPPITEAAMLFTPDMILDLARKEVSHDPAATAWVDRVLRNHFDRKGEILNLPPALKEKIQFPYEDGPVGIIHMIALGPLLAAAVADRRFPDEARALRVSVADAVGFADLAVRKERNRETLSYSELERVRTAKPVTEWKSKSSVSYSATTMLGRLAIQCSFSSHDEGVWEFGWSLSEASERSLERLTRRGTDGRRRSGSGLFTHIDAAIRSVVGEFLNREEPACLVVRGSDPKRNAHYLSTFGSIAPDGYDLVPLRQGSSRAGPDGVDGIHLVRTQEPSLAAAMA